jgi:dienelactone hydrolase
VFGPALRDPVRFFEARRSQRFEAVVDTTWQAGGAEVRSLTVRGFERDGDEEPSVRFEAFLVVPQGPEAPFTSFVLAGGLRTGREAVRFITDRPAMARRAVYLVTDYPYEGPRTFSGLQFLYWLPEIRQALFDAVEAIRLCVDVLVSEPAADPDRIVLLGASFGAFYAVDAGGLDERPAAVIAFMGGGGLAGLLDWNLREGGYTGSRWLSAPAAWLTSLTIRPLEPVRLVGRIAPRPYVQINATGDSRIPEESALKLFEAASEPKRLVWMQTRHVLPHLEEIIQEMFEIAMSEAEALGLIEK